MRVTVYLYHTQLMPIEEVLFRCIKCNRGMFKYSAENIVVANIMGGRDVFLPGMGYLTIECHSCKTPHKILFQ